MSFRVPCAAALFTATSTHLRKSVSRPSMKVGHGEFEETSIKARFPLPSSIATLSDIGANSNGKQAPAPCLELARPWLARFRSLYIYWDAGDFVVGVDGGDEEREVGRQLKTLVCSWLLPLDCCRAAVARWACFPILLAPVFDSVVGGRADFRCNTGCEAPSLSYFNGMATLRKLHPLVSHQLRDSSVE
ncbi:hypothetical protein BHM03_00041138 [Ensete ventricosum]|nr:hypothetical protein BHM03_00041138 [Ensete ventricosum]